MSAAIVASLFVPRVVHTISNARSFGGHFPLITARQRHRVFDAAFRRHSPETRRATRRPGCARRREHDRLSVRHPPLHQIGAWMPRQTSRLAAISGHHVNVHVAGVFAAKRNPFSIGREMRIRCLALETREASRGATRARDRPDVLRISESDLRRAHGWTAQQPCTV